jgi:hypothetical protein
VSENITKHSTHCGPTQSELREIELLSHPLLVKYWPSERRAILAHRFFLSVEIKREASLDECVKSWESGACGPWRRDKMRRDGQQQLKEIERHKYLVSQKLGYDIGAEAAAKDWIENHAGPWREWWELQPESGA